MNSCHRVDPELVAFLDLIPSTALTAESLATNRTRTAAMVASLSVPDYPNVTVTDVHQTRWTIQLWVGNLADPYGPRIHTRYPSLGDWGVIAQLSGRPQGALPALHAGASPAYDLRAYTADIAVIEVHAWADLQR